MTKGDAAALPAAIARRLTPAFHYADEAVGERRSGLMNADGEPLTLRIERWSDKTRLARLGAPAVGRVTAMAPQFSGAFVDVGLDPPGFLAFKGGKTPKGLHEGALIRVEVAGEAQPSAWGGKGPRLRRAPGTAAGAPRVLDRPDQDLQASDGWPDVPPREARKAADRAEDEALATVALLPGGGDIAMEPTRAFWAVDVDAGGRVGPSDHRRAARAVNLAAAAELARHAALRSLGGLVVVDFITTRSRDDAMELHAILSGACALLGVKADVAPLSRSSLCELSLARRRQPVHERLTHPGGALTDETVALRGLRALESAGVAARGAPRLTLRLAPGPYAWLDADEVGWRAALYDRLGPRFAIAVAPHAAHHVVDVVCA